MAGTSTPPSTGGRRVPEPCAIFGARARPGELPRQPRILCAEQRRLICPEQQRERDHLGVSGALDLDDRGRIELGVGRARAVSVHQGLLGTALPFLDRLPGAREGRRVQVAGATLLVPAQGDVQADARADRRAVPKAHRRQTRQACALAERGWLARATRRRQLLVVEGSACRLRSRLALPAGADGETGDVSPLIHRGRAMNTSCLHGSATISTEAKPARRKHARQAAREKMPSAWRSWTTSRVPSAARSAST